MSATRARDRHRPPRRTVRRARTSAGRAATLAATLTALLGGALLTALAGCTTPGGAAGITREQGDAILAELRDIRKELAAQRTKPVQAEEPKPATVRLADVAAHVLGAADAPVTVVEFTDYQCPFCKRFHDRTWPEIRKNYVDTGKVRFLVRDLPLPFHEHAMPAAVAARCAGEQGKYWPARDLLFGAQETLSAEAVRKAMLGIGLAAAAYDACARRPDWQQSIQVDVAEAERIGINGTPGFVVTRKSGGQLEGTLVLGAQPYAVFASRIDALLAEPAEPAKPAKP
jgi:protein-disulfide isomerase